MKKDTQKFHDELTLKIKYKLFLFSEWKCSRGVAVEWRKEKKSEEIILNIIKNFAPPFLSTIVKIYGNCCESLVTSRESRWWEWCEEARAKQTKKNCSSWHTFLQKEVKKVIIFQFLIIFRLNFLSHSLSLPTIHTSALVVWK